MPERFDLKYRAGDREEREEEEKKESADNSASEHSGSVKSRYERPVIVHRAILGSIERFMAILIEKMQGNWPFWLSPRQVKVIPINERVIPFAKKIYYRMKLVSLSENLEKCL